MCVCEIFSKQIRKIIHAQNYKLCYILAIDANYDELNIIYVCLYLMDETTI